MDDDHNLCQICLEMFNTGNRLPKTLECCQQCFCLSCLKDIYKKSNDKLICPICRKIFNKNPVDLKVNKERLEPALKCPNCQIGIKHVDLRIKVSQKGLSVICCSKCCPESNAHDLSEYMINLTDEMNFFINSFCNLKCELFESIVDFQVNSCIDNIFTNLTRRIKEKMKTDIMNEILETYELNLDVNNFNNGNKGNLQIQNRKDLNNQPDPHSKKGLPNKNFETIFKIFSEFEENFATLQKLNEVSLKSKHLPLVKKHVDFYINNSDFIKKTGFKLKKIFEFINNNSIMSFNKSLVDYEEIENFTQKLIDIKITAHKKDFNLNQAENLITNKFIIEGEKFATGIKFIDEKISQLKRDNEKYYQNSLKKDLDYKILERELEASEKLLSDMINDKNKSVETTNNLKSNNYKQNANNINNIQNLDINDIEFIIPLINNDTPVVKKIFYIQNFNFTINSNKNWNFGNFDHTTNSSSSQKNVNNFLESNRGNIPKTQNQLPGLKILPTSKELIDNYDNNEIEKRLFAFDLID